MKKFGIVLLCCSVMAQVASTQSIVTYYVSPGGSDARSCTEARSASTPKRTIRDAVQCLAAGATLLVRGGTYPEAIESAIAPGSSWDNKVRIAAYDGETVWLKPPAGPPWVISLMQGQQFLEFDGINLDTTNA